jgi:molybdopterin-guanine dinucleotide biosynthesis protein A
MPPITSTNGFILAGGQSRRMGQDKATLNWGDKSLLDHMVQLLSTVTAPVRVVGRGRFLDRIPGKGPLGGILTALQSTDRDSNLLLAVDLPLLTPDFLQVFHSRFLASGKPLLACRIGGEFPLCLGIRKDLAAEVEQRVMSDKLSIRGFVEASQGEVLEEAELHRRGFDPAMFANMNTPQDWEKLTKRP